MAELTEGVFPHEESQFIVNEVRTLVNRAIDSTLGNKNYKPDEISLWSSQIVNKCLDGLAMDPKPFKYIVTALIMQKNGAGVHTATSCYWNNETDGSCTIRWENNEMYCIVSVFGLAV